MRPALLADSEPPPSSERPRSAAPSDPLLAGRLAWITGLRVVLVVVLLGILGGLFLRAGVPLSSQSTGIGSAIGVASCVAAVAYAVALRRKKHLFELVHVQLVVDQITWTAVIYVTGGASSGATAFYGLSCLVGAVLLGVRGAMVAATAGAISYTTLCVALFTHLLGPPTDQPRGPYSTDPAQMLPSFLVNLLGLMVVTLLAGYLAERLRLAGGRLAEATLRAEQAERLAALGRLTAGLAHEVRNPLGSILGSIQLLKSAEGLSDEGRYLCEIVERETTRLNDLVDDMLQLARPRAPTLAPVDVARTTREVVRLAEQSGRGRDVRLRYEAPPNDEGVFVEADAGQLRQVVWNLVRNAVQVSSPNAKVRVHVRAETDGVALEVKDDGPGIPSSARAHIFDAFFTTRSSGMGIGLAVVKRIVDDHRWTIEVDSVEGRGATFRVRMPRVAASSVGRIEADAP